MLVHGLHTKHEEYLNKLARGSQIPVLTAHMQNLELQYGIQFSGFVLRQAENIRSTVKVDSDSKVAGYERLLRFVGEYRENPERLFDITRIALLKGSDTLDFDINFVIR